MTIVSRMLERGDIRERCRADGRTAVLPRTRFVFAPWAVWEALVRSFAPMGYEDESGFHYGLPPVNGDLSK